MTINVNPDALPGLDEKFKVLDRVQPASPMPGQARYALPALLSRRARQRWLRSFALAVGTLVALLSVGSRSVVPTAWVQHLDRTAAACRAGGGPVGCFGHFFQPDADGATAHATPKATGTPHAMTPSPRVQSSTPATSASVTAPPPTSSQPGGHPVVVPPAGPTGPAATPTPTPPPSPPPSNTLFADDFSADPVNGGPPAGWTVDGGSWDVVSDQGHAASNGGSWGYLSAGSTSWSDYSMSVLIKPDPWGPGSAGIAARYQDSGNYYACDLRNGTYLYAGKYVNGTWNQLGGTPFSYDQSSWQTLTLQVKGSQVTCSVSGGPTVQFSDSTFTHGRIALDSNYQGKWRRVVVSRS